MYKILKTFSTLKGLLKVGTEFNGAGYSKDQIKLLKDKKIIEEVKSEQPKKEKKKNESTAKSK